VADTVYERSPACDPLGAVLVAAFLSLWALVTLAFLLHTLGERLGARAAVGLLGLDGFDILCSDLGHGPGSSAAHAFSVCAAWLMPAPAVALVVVMLRPRRRSRGGRS
jgi:hypothetical protein